MGGQDGAKRDRRRHDGHADALIKTLTSPVLNTSLSGTAFLDEDDMASDSAMKVASQQSIKAYVDGTTLDLACSGLTLTASTTAAYVAPYDDKATIFTTNRIYLATRGGTLVTLRAYAQTNVAAAATGGVDIWVKNLTTATDSAKLNIATGTNSGNRTISLSYSAGDRLLFAYQSVGGNDAVNNWAFGAGGI